jgi:SAM-dependent methyltransferase
MEFTGEQVVPEVTKKRLIDEDIARYRFAQMYGKDLSVLDIASGTGLGTSILGETARAVLGVDISPESIKYAKEHNQKGNVTYQEGSATDHALFPAQHFPLIVSYETIEHLNAVERKIYLSNLLYWLSGDGYVLISTPNKRVTSPFTAKPENRFHELEFTKEELIKELTPYFRIEAMYGQRQIPVCATNYFVRKCIHVLARFFPSLRTFYTLSGSPDVVPIIKSHEPRIFVFVCRKK